MRKSRFTEEQIVQILHEWDAGGKVADLIRRHGVTEQTLNRWKKKYGGLQSGDAQRLKAFVEENRQLKRLGADQALNLQVVKDPLGKSGDAHAAASGRHTGDADGRHFGAPGVPLHWLCALDAAVCRATRRYRVT